VDRAALVRRLREPFPRRFRAYLRERFPPGSHAVLIASYFSANYFLALAAAGGRPPRGHALTWSIGAGSLLALFFLLRVIDEHRDRERDRHVHPDRLLSRGVIDFQELRMVAGGALLVSGLASAVLGAGTAYLAAIGFAALIASEFFAAGFLERHIFANAAVHMAIMPLFGLYAASVALGELPWRLPEAALVYAGVGYGVGLALEIARKVRSPADERDGLITYSAEWGPFVPAVAVWVCLAASGALSIAVGRMLGFAPWYHGAVLLLLAGVGLGVAHFLLRTSSSTAARLQTYAGAFIFAFDWLLVAELARQGARRR
jgi:4-hydroxybenzoate polyprenyltransferase